VGSEARPSAIACIVGAARVPVRDRLFTAAFIRLGIADLAYFTSGGVAFHALPLYVTGRLGGDNASAGLAFGAFGITALICRPFAGRLADQRGRRPLLLLGALLAGLGMVGIAFADSVPLVVLLRLVQGVAEAAFFVAGFAVLADLAPSTRRGEALSYNSLGLYLGIALGPPLSEFLVERWGFTTAWLAAAVLAVAAGLLALTIGETRPDRSGGEGHARLIHWPAIPAGIGFFTSLAAVGGFVAFAALHSAEIGMSNTSLALLVYGATVVVGRIALARVPDRLPPLPLGSAALILICVGLLVMAISPTQTALITGVLCLALGVTFSTPAFFTAILATAGPDQRGAASGTASAFIDLGLGFGPIALGLVARSQGIPAALGLAAGIAGLGAIWTLGVHSRRPVPAQQSPDTQ
jgi:predicted MFS family arabinose efflux permease